jgi:hypothetical protein
LASALTCGGRAPRAIGLPFRWVLRPSNYEQQVKPGRLLGQVRRHFVGDHPSANAQMSK